MRYLPVFVLSNDLGDSTANGISLTHARKLVVPCPDGHISEEDVAEFGYVVLELQPPSVAGYPSKFTQRGETRWTMFGGNYVTTSDSRFGRIYGHSPIAVHDRIEGK